MTDPEESLIMDVLDYSTLPLQRLRVIDEKTQRNGRVILVCGGPLARFGTPQTRFECGGCETLLVIGARLAVGELLFHCRCGALNEVEGVAVGASTPFHDPRRLLSNG